MGTHSPVAVHTNDARRDWMPRPRRRVQTAPRPTNVGCKPPRSAERVSAARILRESQFHARLGESRWTRRCDSKPSTRNAQETQVTRAGRQRARTGGQWLLSVGHAAGLTSAGPTQGPRHGQPGRALVVGRPTRLVPRTQQGDARLAAAEPPGPFLSPPATEAAELRSSWSSTRCTTTTTTRLYSLLPRTFASEVRQQHRRAAPWPAPLPRRGRSRTALFRRALERV